ncbi:ferritin-like domain-containing protein [Microvirga massiliensis]|uniref:YciE/YciF ferroxidase family protein n=1 Tax=Microvirga massiliensis TaxID=1033741 RepID=UPI00062B977B|nr:ferritin-like domain-containing protein [Microvirga massiliensis]
MNVNNFRQMYVTELQELRSVEAQLVDALPTMADAASHSELKQAIQSHLQETRSQRDRLDEILRRHGAEPREHVDQSMQAIVRESEKWAKMVEEAELRDAGLIASAQRVEHYEIAVYGTLATWAKQLGLDEDLRTLLAILEEEKRTDEKLTDLAKQVVNPDAAST